jgi:hypothetical protein
MSGSKPGSGMCVGCGKTYAAPELLAGQFVGWGSVSVEHQTTYRFTQEVHQTTTTYRGVQQFSAPVCKRCSRREWRSYASGMFFRQALLLLFALPVCWGVYEYGITALARRFPPVADFHVGYVLGWVVFYVAAMLTIIGLGTLWWNIEPHLTFPAGSVALRASRLKRGMPGTVGHLKGREEAFGN